MYLRTCTPSDDSDQPALSNSLIKIFTRCILNSQGYKVYPCEQQKFKADCADAQADLRHRCAHISDGTFSHVAVLIYLFRILSCVFGQIV